MLGWMVVRFRRETLKGEQKETPKKKKKKKKERVGIATLQKNKKTSPKNWTPESSKTPTKVIFSQFFISCPTLFHFPKKNHHLFFFFFFSFSRSRLLACLFCLEIQGALSLLFLMNFSVFRSTAAAQAVRNAWGWYSKTLDLHPIKTKMATTFTIFTTADILRQRLEHQPSNPPPFPLQPPPSTTTSSPQVQAQLIPITTTLKGIFPEWYDWYRTARLAGFYSIVNAPWVHTTNFLYDFFLGRKVHTAGVLIRTVGDMAFFMPLFMNIMLPSQALLAGHSMEVAKKHTEEKIWPLLQGAWLCFIPVSVFNFIFIQTKFRVLTLNMTQLVFGVYVSKMANGVISEETEPKQHHEQQHESEEKRTRTTQVDVTTTN